jgi:hypothetical protein
MTTITTKYDIGQKVYYASTCVEQKQHPCPDCHGTKRWKALSPAGTEYEFDCPRCSTGYRAEDELSLDYAILAPTVSKLTIGSVRVDTKPFGRDDQVSYMCVETGVGSGSIYNESKLFLTEEEALKVATAMCIQTENQPQWMPILYNKTLNISDYQLADGREHLEKTKLYELQWKFVDLLADIESCGSLVEVKELVERERN